MNINKSLWCITNTDKSFTFLGNTSVEGSQENDNHINTDISENLDDSFHLSQTKSKTGNEEIQNSQCTNTNWKKYVFLKLGFTPCKTGQPLQGMKLQEKEAQKD